MKKISILVVLITILLTACGTTIEPYSNMSGYKVYDSNIEYRFNDATVADLKKYIDQKKTGIFYFGFANCPWCNDVINIISTEIPYDIQYIDTRAHGEQNNTEIEGYDYIIDLFGDQLKQDDNGKPHLYVPTLVFIKNGEILDVMGPLDYNAGKEQLPEDLKLQFVEKLHTNLEGLLR